MATNGIRFTSSSKLKTQKQLATIINDISKSLFVKVEQKINKEFKQELRIILANTPVYRAITGIALRGQFGLTGAEGKINAILEAFIKSIRLSLKVTGRTEGIIGRRITLEIDVPYEDLLNLPEAEQLRLEALRRAQDEDLATEDFLLPWLEWLLLEGTSVVVSDHHVVRNKGIGRSGLRYLMEKGGDYRVPSKFAGRRDDNFITNALSENGKFLRRRLLRIVRNELKNVL